MQMRLRSISASAALLLTLGLLASSPRFARAETTTFSNGNGGWQFNGDAHIVPNGGNPGAYMAYQAIDTFGVDVHNDSNPGFLGDVYFNPVTISIDVRTDSIIFEGREVARDLYVELRDTTTPNEWGLPWISVFYRLGELTSSEPGWRHYSVTITDPNSAILPPGWVGYGAEDPQGHPILPPGITFADVLHNVDVIRFTTYGPGMFYGFTNFDLAFDNLGVNAVPEPPSVAMLGLAALGLTGILRWRAARRQPGPRDDLRRAG